MLDVASPRTEQWVQFHKDVLSGLARRQKALPSRWLYDDKGCALFEEITTLAEYYPTRAETAILRGHAQAIGAFIRPGVLLEYGAGSAIKSEIVLEAAQSDTYVPIDIAGDFLDQSAARLRSRFPGLATIPLIADFTMDFDLPQGLGYPRTVFFPGSTIGNLDTLETHSLLARMRIHAGHNGRAIIGIDLKKEIDVLLPAYDDARGVTAAFNRNMLERINRELDGTFDMAAFSHEARWNAQDSSVEMHLLSHRDQTVRVKGIPFEFRAGETIHTESSRKYDVPGFASIAEQAGWSCVRVWSDPGASFALIGLSV